MDIAETIEHLSSFWRLEPGDLIYTGTPEGVGAVKSGDLMEGSVAGVGTLKVEVRRAERRPTGRQAARHDGPKAGRRSP